MIQEEGTSTVQVDSTGTDLVENLVIKIVPLLVKSADEALKLPAYGGLEFATLLLEEALKYGNLYPRAYGLQSELMNMTVKKFRQWNAFGDGNR